LVGRTGKEYQKKIILIMVVVVLNYVLMTYHMMNIHIPINIKKIIFGIVVVMQKNKKW